MLLFHSWGRGIQEREHAQLTPPPSPLPAHFLRVALSGQHTHSRAHGILWARQHLLAQSEWVSLQEAWPTPMLPCWGHLLGPPASTHLCWPHRLWRGAPRTRAVSYTPPTASPPTPVHPQGHHHCLGGQFGREADARMVWESQTHSPCHHPGDFSLSRRALSPLLKAGQQSKPPVQMAWGELPVDTVLVWGSPSTRPLSITPPYLTEKPHSVYPQPAPTAGQSIGPKGLQAQVGSKKGPARDMKQRDHAAGTTRPPPRTSQ